MDKIQYRTAEFKRSEESTDDNIIEGYFAIYDQTVDIFYWKERIAQGAFEYEDVKMLINHDQSPLNCLGALKSGTLKLQSDTHGLFATCDLPDTNSGRDIKVSCKRGDIDKASIGFEVLDSTWETVNGVEVETITRAKLWEVSVVTFPAYESTDVYARSKERMQKNEEQKKRSMLLSKLKKKGAIK